MLSDLRLTLRTLAKSPGFVVVAVLTLTLGIGVNAAIFGIVNGVLLRGLPFPESERLLGINTGKPREGESRTALSSAEFADLRARQQSFEDLTAYTDGTVSVSGPGGDPERVNGCTMRGAGVLLLRVPPAHGRWFTPDDDKAAAPPTVVIGYKLWENRYRSDPAVLGQQLKINGEWATIIGVGPKKFRFPEESDLWRPERFAKTDEAWDNRYLAVFGRLKPGVTLEQARAELAAIGRQWAADHVDTNKDRELLVRRYHDAFVDDGTRRMVWIMFGAVGFVLLIACANVANLLLARAAVRQKEICVRAALGAGRGRIVRLLLAESLMLSAGGAALGLPLGAGLLALLNYDLQTKPPPYWMVLDLDARGVAYIAGLAVLTTIVAGLWPAWRASRADLNTMLKDGGRGSTGFALSRFTRAMVIGEVALSCVLLVLAGLSIRTVIKTQTTPLGFETAGVFTCRVMLPETNYKEPARQQRFWRDLLERLAARPEIAAVALSDTRPTWTNRNQVEFEGQPRGGPKGSGLPEQYADRAAVSGGYFAALGIKLVQGRTFDDRDVVGAPRVAVVSTRFAERHWPHDNPLGKKFVYGLGLNVKPADWITVVGVVTPTLQADFDNEHSEERPQSYVSFAQESGTRYTSVFAKARTGPPSPGSGAASDPAMLAPVVRATVRGLDEDLPVYFVQTLERMMSDARYFKGLFAWIFGIFGGVALVLAGVGLYGVMSYSVSQRTQEIGVRMALGAEPRDVLAMILREGGLRLALGLVIGLVAGFFCGRLLAFVLWGVTPGDPATFAATLLTLGATGLVACVVPALRAVRVNPVEALRHE